MHFWIITEDNQMDFKYIRIQGRELSYVTKAPKGIFAMCWRMIYDDIMCVKDAENFKTINTNGKADDRAKRNGERKN